MIALPKIDSCQFERQLFYSDLKELVKNEEVSSFDITNIREDSDRVVQETCVLAGKNKDAVERVMRESLDPYIKGLELRYVALEIKNLQSRFIDCAAGLVPRTTFVMLESQIKHLFSLITDYDDDQNKLISLAKQCMSIGKVELIISEIEHLSKSGDLVLLAQAVVVLDQKRDSIEQMLGDLDPKWQVPFQARMSKIDGIRVELPKMDEEKKLAWPAMQADISQLTNFSSNLEWTKDVVLLRRHLLPYLAFKLVFPDKENEDLERLLVYCELLEMSECLSGNELTSISDLEKIRKRHEMFGSSSVVLPRLAKKVYIDVGSVLSQSAPELTSSLLGSRSNR